MPEITDAELAEYQQLRFIQQQQEPQDGDSTPHVVLTRRRASLLADGTLHEYTGMHPTHVDTGSGVVPVMIAREL